MNERNPLDYRPCVGIMLVNEEGQVFVGKRIDNREGDWWQMPQGGVDKGEEPSDAAYRELEEETGATRDDVELITRLDSEIFYDLPSELKGKLWGGKYIGQRQIWYLARFTGTDDDINLEAHDPAEFCEWKWVEAETLPDLIVPFKRAVYSEVVNGFRDDINL
ncbi:RNA pyrophosphohydrolase [Altererythrobacter indicus]|uniref:RNA pyrophosphohydrolase n=1 Tax=Altericroceibacterium indicum TaxID=374177 RepID=A0A845ACN2_9SPHN|nr:RNA pyrophosphohydrolase [Altericroceibacterium indicum]MXP24948.1 RNA pyrophosphohydrolase [Altericroceibacterium indicum]